MAPAPLRSASLRSASLRSAGATPDEEPKTTTLGFTLILLLALLTKFSQENCLSYVGTEGWKNSHNQSGPSRCIAIPEMRLSENLARVASEMNATARKLTEDVKISE